MISKDEYIKNPTKASSLAYFKSELIPIGIKIEIVDKVYDNCLNKYFFKVVNYLDNIKRPILDNKYEFKNVSTKEYVDHINSCYENISITESELNEYKNNKVYDSDLWLAIIDKNTNKVIGSIIAEYDKEISEGIIEWVEVSEGFRGKGIGKKLVNEILYRLKDKARFVTVSGDMNNKTNPYKLYERCGFKDCVIYKIGD